MGLVVRSGLLEIASQRNRSLAGRREVHGLFKKKNPKLLAVTWGSLGVQPMIIANFISQNDSAVLNLFAQKAILS